MKSHEVDITITVSCKATLPKEFLVKYKDLEDDDLTSMFYEEIFPIWFDVDTNGDEVIIANRNEETIEIYFTYDSYTTEHYRPGDWYTPDEYTYDWDEHNFPIPNGLLTKMNQNFETN